MSGALRGVGFGSCLLGSELVGGSAPALGRLMCDGAGQPGREQLSLSVPTGVSGVRAARRGCCAGRTLPSCRQVQPLAPSQLLLLAAGGCQSPGILVCLAAPAALPCSLTSWRWHLHVHSLCLAPRDSCHGAAALGAVNAQLSLCEKNTNPAQMELGS